MAFPLNNLKKWHVIIVVFLSGLSLITSISFGQNQQAGEVIQDEFGVEMVYVPGGIFTLGIDLERLRFLCEQHGEDDPDRCVEIIREDSGATYLQTVEIQPFWIDRFEMTREQFNAFCGVDANTDVDDCLDVPRDPELSVSPQQPQADVSWYTADFICRLRYARLPTEAEWEYAASGPDKSIFAWGDTFNLEFIQHSDSQYPQTYPVGTISENQSWVGAFDMTGNVEEWVEDRFGTRILSSLDVEDWQAPMPLNSFEVFRVTKGGFWNSPYWYLTNFYREYTSPETMSENIGFRCARSLIAG